jgi:hypothetical protein
MESPNDLHPEIRSTNAPAEMMRLLDWMMTSKPTPVLYCPFLPTFFPNFWQDDLFFNRGNSTMIQRIQEVRTPALG